MSTLLLTYICITVIAVSIVLTVVTIGMKDTRSWRGYITVGDVTFSIGMVLLALMPVAQLIILICALVALWEALDMSDRWNKLMNYRIGRKPPAEQG